MYIITRHVHLHPQGDWFGYWHLITCLYKNSYNTYRGLYSCFISVFISAALMEEQLLIIGSLLFCHLATFLLRHILSVYRTVWAQDIAVGQFAENFLPANHHELCVTANYRYAFSDHFHISSALLIRRVNKYISSCKPSWVVCHCKLLLYL